MRTKKLEISSSNFRMKSLQKIKTLTLNKWIKLWCREEKKCETTLLKVLSKLFKILKIK